MSASRLGGESKGFLLVLVTSIAVIVGAFLLRPDGPEEAFDASKVPDSVTSPTPTGSASPAAKPRKDPTATEGQQPPTQGGFAVAPPSLPIPPGLNGNGGSVSLPKHRLTIRWTSGNPLGLIAYIVPTSQEHNEGSWVERTRRELTISTTVYGRPDYAIAYVQAGGTGAPATCEIFVDGKRTARRTTQGPYGAVWCQG